MTAPRPGVQTQAERRSAEAELRRLVTEFAPAHARLVAAARRALRARLATAHELVYGYRDCMVISFSPSGRGHEGVLAIRASADGVKLYFNQGKTLPDPARRLRGYATQVRWIALERSATLAEPDVERLVTEAIARNAVPFAETGRGSVVLR